MSRRNGEPAPAWSGPTATRGSRAAIALALTWAALIVAPACLIGYVFVTLFHLGPDPVPKAQLDRAHAGEMALAIVILVIPAIGCVLAARTKHPVQAGVFGVLLVAASIISLGLHAIAERPKPPEPAPVVTQCIPRSGGHGCPGG